MAFKFYAALLVITLLIIKSIKVSSNETKVSSNETKISSNETNIASNETNQIEPYHYEVEANPNLCNFFDTINITDGIINADNSITFEDVRYKNGDDYAIFNYTYLPNQTKVDAIPHIRGCVCKYKNCVRLCCPYGYSFYAEYIGNKSIQNCTFNEHLNSLSVKHLHEQEEKVIDLMGKHGLALVFEKPCRNAYFLEPEEMVLDEWTLLSNGSLMIGETIDLIIAKHDEYCIGHVYQESTNNYLVKAMQCSLDQGDQIPIKPDMFGQLLYGAFMVVSVVFLLLTLFVYIWIEELRRTIHGKNLMCYLAMLIVGYSFLAFTLIENSHGSKGAIKCVILAEIIHTAFISSFIWLSIISFDIWRTIGRTDNHRNQFFKYCIFAYGLTFLILLITNLLDFLPWLPIDYRPELGTTVCWLQDEKYSHFLYLYSILITVITVNSVFFILTKLKIDFVKRISDRATNCEGSRKFSSREETDADRFGLYLRLFIIMGILWIIEIISWLIDAEGTLAYILDVTTMLQGPIIFFLFIKKKRVKKLIMRKLSTTPFGSNQSNRRSASGVNSSSAVTTITRSSVKLDELKTGHN